MLLPLFAGAASPDFSKAEAVITNAIAAQVFPGAAAAVLDGNGQILLSQSFGSQVYAGQTAPLGGNAAVTNASLWDMASLTKIVGVTTSAALLSQRGLLDLDMPVSSPALLGPAFAAAGKGAITVRDCLLHQAGFPADPSPGYSLQSFGCPATKVQPTPPLTLSCAELIIASVRAQTLAYAPRTAWLYSDLSMITLALALGGLIETEGLVPARALRPDCAGAAALTGAARLCHFEAFVREEVLRPVAMTASGFLPVPERWTSAMPTYTDSTYRHEIMQGAVSDENAYASGGLSGHAGLFSTLDDMAAFARLWAVRQPPLIEQATRDHFLSAPDPAASPRALGWLTQSPADTYHLCGDWPNSTAYHTGYTGTLVCIDVETNVSLVLLTNRVYPNSTGNADSILVVRRDFATAVRAALVGADVGVGRSDERR